MFPSNFLADLGAGARVLAAFEPFATQGLMLGRVCVSIRDEYRLLVENGELRAEPAGALLYGAVRQSELPAVGDWVAARQADAEFAIVHAVLPRQGQFSRRAAGEREDEQVIAANVDVVLIVCGLDNDFNLRRLERYLTLAHESGAEPVVVLNKADLCDAPQNRASEVRETLGGVEVVVIGARDGFGVDALDRWMGPGRTVTLLGSSGAGKSTLVNRLLNAERQRTSDVRASDSRGRHTTTHRELMPLPGGGCLIDNPGMRELQMWAGEASLDTTFADVTAFASSCKFADCSHSSEPGCGVAAALDSGKLGQDRWASYLKLRAEIRYHEVRSSPTAAAAQKQRWKSIHKAMRVYKKHW